jgi:DNA-binding Lrp family transcriptional regulator
MERLKDQLKILSKRHTMELIKALLDGPQYISQLSEELGMPYTTAQQRVAELERAALVEIEASVDEASKRAVKRVRLRSFRIDLSPRNIKALVDGEDDEVLRVI